MSIRCASRSRIEGSECKWPLASASCLVLAHCNFIFPTPLFAPSLSMMMDHDIRFCFSHSYWACHPGLVSLSLPSVAPLSLCSSPHLNTFISPLPSDKLRLGGWGATKGRHKSGMPSFSFPFNFVLPFSKSGSEISSPKT